MACSPILGCGQAECNWKEYKDNLGGKRAKLAPEKAKKLLVISASYSHKRCEACGNRARRADVLFNDEDFKFCKLDNYCSDSIIRCLKKRDVRVFHAYMEDWEKVQLIERGMTCTLQQCLQSMGG